MAVTGFVSLVLNYSFFSVSSVFLVAPLVGFLPCPMI